MAYLTETNYTEVTQDRLTDFFKNKPIFWRYLRLITGYSQSMFSEIRNVGLNRWIDSASGAQLDILGNIVGQDRVLYGADAIDWFGYAPFLTAKEYGDANDPTKGGYYRDENTAVANDVRLADAQYRIFIKAKIMKNVITPTPENIIRFIEFVFDVPLVQITESAYGKASFIVYSNTLTTYEKFILLYSNEGKNFVNYFIPKTLGVLYNITIQDVPTDNFGFLEDFSAKSFGSTDNSDGGVWSGTINEDDI